MSHVDWLVLISGVVILTVCCWLMTRCSHFWDLVDKQEFPSIIEEYTKNKVDLSTGLFWASDIERMGIRRLVLVLRCNRCGASKVKKIDSGP